MAGIAGEGGIDVDEGDVPKGNLFDQFITLVSGLFQPMLGVLSAAGMIKGVVAILAAVGVAKTDGLYIILNAAGDGLFQKKLFQMWLRSSLFLSVFSLSQFHSLSWQSVQ